MASCKSHTNCCNKRWQHISRAMTIIDNLLSNHENFSTGDAKLLVELMGLKQTRQDAAKLHEEALEKMRNKALDQNNTNTREQLKYFVLPFVPDKGYKLYMEHQSTKQMNEGVQIAATNNAATVAAHKKKMQKLEDNKSKKKKPADEDEDDIFEKSLI